MKTILRGLDPGVPEQYQDFWNGISQYLDWFDVIHWSERPLRPDWNHLRVMIVRLLMSGAQSTYMLAALTSSVRLVVSESLLILRLVMHLIARISLSEVTVLASVVSVNIKNVRNKWRLTASHWKSAQVIIVTLL